MRGYSKRLEPGIMDPWGIVFFRACGLSFCGLGFQGLRSHSATRSLGPAVGPLYPSPFVQG